MHIDKMMIIKVASDATVAITTTKFLSSSGGSRLNGLSETFFVAIVEGVKTLFDVVVEDTVFEAFFVAVTAIVLVVVIVVVMAVPMTDMQGGSFAGANRVIGS